MSKSTNQFRWSKAQTKFGDPRTDTEVEMDTGATRYIDDTQVREMVLRRGLEHRFGLLDDRIWNLLNDRGSVLRVLERKAPFESLVRELAQLQRIFGTPLKQGVAPQMLLVDAAGAPDYPAREVALSRIVADVMTNDAAVVAFRKDPAHHLQGWPLSWEAVQKWIESWDTSGVLPTRYIDHVPVPASAEREVHRTLILRAQTPDIAQGAPSTEIPRVSLSVPVTEVHEHAHFSFLYYGIPGDPTEFLVPVRDGTPLARLQQLSASLAGRTTWSEAQATLFVLTGLTPLITTMQSEVLQNLELPGMSRIVLTVDPGLSPREVADRFREVRKRFYQHRYRELSDKHLQLALFAALEAPEGPVAARMEAWNLRYPQWAYAQESNFSHDSLQAQRRLVGSLVSGRRGRRDTKKGEGV